MSRNITIKGIKYTLALTTVTAGFQVALAVLNAQGYINNTYPSVVATYSTYSTYSTYGDAIDKYSSLYRYNTGKEL